MTVTVTVSVQPQVLALEVVLEVLSVVGVLVMVELVEGLHSTLLAETDRWDSRFHCLLGRGWCARLLARGSGGDTA